MTSSSLQIIESTIVEDEVHLSISELCHTTSAETQHVIEWVYEGILTPLGSDPNDWHFTGNSLRRTKEALILSRDLEINTPGVAMILDLLDEITRLKK